MTRRATASRITHGGTPEVQTLEGNFDLAILVDAGSIGDPEAGDSMRIKALVGLVVMAGGQAAFVLLRALELPGKYCHFCPASRLHGGDSQAVPC